MFELEDSEGVKLERCKTDSETLLKGRNLSGVGAVDCEAKKSPEPVESSESRPFKFLGLTINWLATIAASVIATAITAWFGFS
jgi:hypothetical protein